MANSPTNALNHPIAPSKPSRPRPVVSAHGNVGASQPHGTAKLTPHTPAVQGGHGPPILPTRVAPMSPKALRAAGAAYNYRPAKGAKFSALPLQFQPTFSGGATPGQLAQERASLVPHTSAYLKQLLNHKMSVADSTTGGGLLAAISPFAGPSGGPALINAATDYAKLPIHQIEGVSQLGGAAIDDFLHGHFGYTNLGAVGAGNQSKLGSMLQSAAQQDPAVNALEGHFGKAWQLAKQNPLNAGLDVLGGAGVVGRAAGGLARLGVAGSKAQDFAQLSRAREIVPGAPGTVSRMPYSRNIVTQAVQKALEAHPQFASTIAKATGVTRRAIKRSTSFTYGQQKARTLQEMQAAKKGLLAVKPGKVEAPVTQFLTGFGGGRDTLLQRLEQYRIERATAPGRLRQATINNLDTHIANLERATAKPDLNLPAIEHAAADYRTRQASIEAQKAALGMNTQPELQAALEKQFALGRPDLFPNAQYLHEGVTHPEVIAERAGTKSDLAQARKDYAAAVKASGDTAGAHAAASRALADAQKRLPLHPATDSFANHLADMRAAVGESAPATKAEHAAEVKAAAAEVKAAEAAHKLAMSDKSQLKGVVVHDPAAPAIQSGALKGQTLRQLTSDEIRPFLQSDPAAYIRMVNSDRHAPMTFAKLRDNQLAPSSLTGKTYTGEAARIGDQSPGYGLLADSQMHDIMSVGRVRMEKNWFDRFGIKKGDGTYFGPHDDVQAAADKYEATHHIPVEPVADATNPERIALIPKASVDEMRQQLKLDNPGAIARGNMKITRGLRNTVLPWSPKLPVMHTVEGTVRALLQAPDPTSLYLGRAMVKAAHQLDPTFGAELEHAVAPGGQAGGSIAMDQEDMGRFGRVAPTTKVGKVVALPGKAMRGYTNVAHKMLTAQRWIEKPAQYTAFGVHGRKLVQEMGLSITKAHGSLKELAMQLAKEHHADPALVERAAQHLHDTMGQYNNFPAKQRFLFSRLAPFGSWYTNAAKLVYKELPLHHPLKTALLLDVAKANQAAWDKTHAAVDKSAPDLQAATLLDPNHYLDVGKFTPALNGANPLATALQLIAPQYASAGMGLLGLDPFAKPFKGPHTPYGQDAVSPFSLQAIEHAAESFGEGVGGPANFVARGLQSHGQTLYNTSMPLFGSVQRKPNTSHGPGGIAGGLLREINPFYGTYFGGGSSGGRPGKGGGLGRAHLGRGGLGHAKLSKATAGNARKYGPDPFTHENIKHFVERMTRSDMNPYELTQHFLHYPAQPPLFPTGRQGGYYMSPHGVLPDTLPARPDMSGTQTKILRNWLKGDHAGGMHLTPPTKITARRV